MTARRLARLVTRRATIVKFKGAYHGHSDQVLAPHTDSLGALAAEPVWKGIPLATVRQTVHASYNDVAGIKEIFAENGREVDAVLVELIEHTMGLVQGPGEVLGTLRQLCHEHAITPVGHQIVNGFRLPSRLFSSACGFT